MKKPVPTVHTTLKAHLETAAELRDFLGFALRNKGV